MTGSYSEVGSRVSERRMPLPAWAGHSSDLGWTRSPGTLATEVPGIPRRHGLPRGQYRRAFLRRHKLPHVVSGINLPRTRDLLLRISDQFLPLRQPA